MLKNLFEVRYKKLWIWVINVSKKILLLRLILMIVLIIMVRIFRKLIKLGKKFIKMCISRWRKLPHSMFKQVRRLIRKLHSWLLPRKRWNWLPMLLLLPFLWKSHHSKSKKKRIMKEIDNVKEKNKEKGNEKGKEKKRDRNRDKEKKGKDRDKGKDSNKG